jgi:heptosyltransferase-2
MAAASKILIVGPAWVGDMVMTQSLARLLREREPGVVIDVLGPAWSLPLVARMGEVRRGIALAAGHGELALAERWRLGRQLRAEGYRQAIVVPRSLKSALVPFFAGIPARTGFRTEMRAALLTDARELDRGRLDQTMKRLLALGLPPGAPMPEPPQPSLRIEPRNLAALRARHALGESPAVAMMPGAAFGPAKQWPVEHFAALAQLLAQRGLATWVLGAAGEHALGEHICAAAGGAARNLCGETRLEDVVDLLSAARAAVTNDSGLMHVAAAVGTHVVALYGSSSPAFTPPLTARRTVHHLGLSCSPCFERECPLGHLRCLRDITPEAVLVSVTAGAGFPSS